MRHVYIRRLVLGIAGALLLMVVAFALLRAG